MLSQEHVHHAEANRLNLMQGKQQECLLEAGMLCSRPVPILSGEGVGRLVVVLDQGAEGVDQILDLGLLYAEQIEFSGDLAQLGHGLFVGNAIGIHFVLLHWAKCSIGFPWEH